MTDWSGGYVTGIGYTLRAYREVLPAWLRFVSLLVGQPEPRLDRSYRQAELGCGYGLSTLAAAASLPEAGFWGFDFNPAHIEQGRDIAARAGIANARLEERSFADLADASDLPAFDAIVLHGIWSWVGPAEQQDIIRFIARRLRPGGLVAISYNVSAGWAQVEPLLPLMRRLAAGAARPDLAFSQIWATLDALRDAKANYFSLHPSTAQRLQILRDSNPRYAAHEVLNVHSRPTDFASVAAAMAEAKCGFVASATLTDNFPAASVPAGMIPMLDQAGADIVWRETLRDIGAAQSFRRDVFRKGEQPVVAGPRARALDALVLVQSAAPGREELKIPSSLGELTGKPEVYLPVIRRIEQGPLPFPELRQMPALSAMSLTDCVQVLAMVVAAGVAHPLLPHGPDPAARAATRGLNAEIARRNALGETLNILAAPDSGLLVAADPAVTLAVAALATKDDLDRDGIVAAMASTLDEAGTTLRPVNLPEGQAPDPASVLAQAAGQALGPLRPMLAGLGIV